jgi:putative hemolysin
MDLKHVLLLAILPVCIGASACCSAMETAVFSLTHGDRLVLKRASPGAAATVASLLAKPRSLIVSLLLANITVNSAYMAAGTVLIHGLDAAWLKVAGGLAIPLVLIACGEVLPKSLATSNRVLVCRLLVRPLALWHALAWPVRALADTLIVTPASRILSGGGVRVDPITADELGLLLEHGGREGAFDREEQELLADVVSLGALRVRDVMIPRVDIDVLEAGASTEDVIRLVRAHGHTKFPVCRGSLDSGVLGFLNAKKYFTARERAGRDVAVIDCLDPARFVPERARVDQLLEHFRATRSHVAICVDEHGTITGLVEVEDAVREIVATSASTEAQDASQVRPVGPGRWEVGGRLSIRDWALVFRLPPEELSPRLSTIGGLITARLGRMPRPGDTVLVGNVRLEVTSVSARAIDRVAVSLATAPARPEGGKAA